MRYQFDPRNLEREVELVLPEQLRFLRACNAVKQKEVAAALHIHRSSKTRKGHEQYGHRKNNDSC